MCPDSELLSAYFDHEVPSPWKEKLELHVSTCGACGARLGAYGKVRSAFSSSPEPDLLAHKAQVLEAVRSRYSVRKFENPVAGLWRRSVEVPVPLMAMAAVMIAVLAGAVMIGNASGSKGSPSLASLERTNAIPVTVQFSDMKSVVQYLDSQGDKRDIMIVLPDASHFNVQGNPQLMKASDFSRSLRH
jgi:anti-sigma factor RsiW